MPLTLSSLDRRRFIGGALSTFGTLAASRFACSAEGATHPDRFALLADTHIAEDPERVLRGVKLSSHLEAVCNEILELKEKPSAAFIDGDCAVTRGEVGDYATLLKLLNPVREHGVPVHLALGNHDDRDNFWNGLTFTRDQHAFDGKHASLVSSPRANWLVLDSLDKVNVTPGLLGGEQLEWLAKTLDSNPDKPALLMTHHNPTFEGNKNALIDTQALFDVIGPRKQVKALFFGHTHSWSQTVHEGIHLVNLPPVAYVFREGNPSGWVDCLLRDGGMQLTLHSLDPDHPKHLQAMDLAYRR